MFTYWKLGPVEFFWWSDWKFSFKVGAACWIDLGKLSIAIGR